MMTVEVFVAGRVLTADAERELAVRILRALTTEDAAPDSVLDSAREFVHSGDRPEAPDGSTIDPVCGMAVEWATARFTLTHDGVDYAFCAPSCRKVFAEDHAMT